MEKRKTLALVSKLMRVKTFVGNKVYCVKVFNSDCLKLSIASDQCSSQLKTHINLIRK